VPVQAEEGLAVDHAPELVTRNYAIADLIVPLTSTGGATGQEDPDWLIDLIELRTGTDCWAHGGGAGMIRLHAPTLSLIVRQTQATHERIADLLDEIRGTGQLALCIEVQFVRGNLDNCDEARPFRSPQGLVDSAGKQRMLQAVNRQPNGKVFSAPKITFFNGTTAFVETTDENGGTKSFNVRGVISRDNRYSRLWLDANVYGQTTHAEVLIPEGHTAVRKLAGENNWLLLTSHVINAEEPQVIAPLKQAVAPAPEQKRYLVPVDDSPEPTELTNVPQFKAQAEGFGLAIQRTTGAADAALETATAALDAQPELASAVDRVEYQVAQAEPRHVTVTPVAPPPPPMAVLNAERSPRREPRPELSMLIPGAALFSAAEEAPYRLWIGDTDQDVAHALENAPAPVDPPARLDVCLDNPDCGSNSKPPVRVGQMFERIFVTPLPEFPLFWNEQATRAGSIGATGKTSPRVTVSNIEYGRHAILSRAKSRNEPGCPLEAPSAQAETVQLVAGVGGEVGAIESHLTSAAAGLKQLGLESEAKMLAAISRSMRLRIEHRCRQIDAEIEQLQAERAKLEALRSGQAAGARSELR